MLGINENVKSLRIDINQRGTAISEIYINEKPVKKEHYKVERIGFEFFIGQDGVIRIACHREDECLAHSEKRETAAALAGDTAARSAT